MSDAHDPEPDLAQQSGPDEDDRGPLLAPDDVDPVDHPVDTVSVDEEETAVPGEWL